MLTDLSLEEAFWIDRWDINKSWILFWCCSCVTSFSRKFFGSSSRLSPQLTTLKFNLSQQLFDQESNQFSFVVLAFALPDCKVVCIKIMADFDVIYQDSRDAGLSSRPSTSGRSVTSSRSDTRRGLGERSDSIGGSIMHRITRRNSSNNAIARPSSSGDGVAAIEDDEGSAMVAVIDSDIAPDGYNFAALVTPDPVVIRGAGNITV